MSQQGRHDEVGKRESLPLLSYSISFNHTHKTQLTHPAKQGNEPR